MSISRVTASLATGINETTLALANLNFDFSLIKVEAPQEFKGLGHSLTPQRREIAEDGSVHRTARRLGALFEEVAPLTPSLIRAYGHRASEISQSVAKAERSQRNGVFANCAGVDGTSVWAAATSGGSAIAIHLLACMLARTWSGPQATSIWVEIVTERKRILQDRIASGLYNSSVQLTLAVSDALSRHDLAQWDSSARAWLQIADDSQLRHQKQLMLVVNNVNIPVNQGDKTVTTYERVIEAWRTAMTALENLINGQSQRVSKGSVLLGLASWHLYPTLLVVSKETQIIEFNDTIIPDSGQLIIGLENPNPDRDEGVYWSLSLAHLKYYGDPVTATSFTVRDASKLTIEEFHLLVLGSVLSSWGRLGSNLDVAVRFFIALDDCLMRARQQRSPTWTSSPQASDAGLTVKLSWVAILAKAARKVLSLEGADKDIATSIVALGHRRGHSLLVEKGNRPLPMMGLCHPFIRSVLESSDCSTMTAERTQLHMMKFIAEKIGLRHEQCILRVPAVNGGATYRTMFPHTFSRNENAQVEFLRTHQSNWIEVDLDNLISSVPCNCHATGHSCHKQRCPCMHRGRLCTSNCHDEGVQKTAICPGCVRDVNTSLIYGCDNLLEGMSCRYVKSPLFVPLEMDNRVKLTKGGVNVLDLMSFTDEERRILIRSGISLKLDSGASNYTTEAPRSIQLAPGQRLCACFERSRRKVPPTFTLLAGDPDGIGLFVISDEEHELRERTRIHSALSKEMPLGSVEEVCKALQPGGLAETSVLNYVENLYRHPVIQFPSFHKDVRVRSTNFGLFLKSLHGLVLATHVYEQLPGATINLSLIAQPLHKALWIPGTDECTLNRQEKLACIAMLESGSYNIPPDDMNDVIAISARNSIFVSRILLNDPFSSDHVQDITRVVGNVGRTGMVLMVAPQAPRIRRTNLEDWTQVTHAPFDGKLEDSFNSTSLHLRFTEFELPLDRGNRGAIDKDLCLVETLVQVYDQGKWIADLDVLPLFDIGNDMIRRSQIQCTGCSQDSKPPRQLKSIDHWEELLDVPESWGVEHVGVVKAYQNWLARLATACFCLQRGFRLVILPLKEPCWACCCRKRWGWERETILKTVESASCVGDADNQADENDVVDEYESDDSDDSVVSALLAEGWEESATTEDHHLPQVFII